MDKDTRADYANVERDASQKNRSVSDLASFLVANFQTSMVQGVGTVKSVTYSDDGKTVVSAVADVSGSEEAVNVPYGKTVRVADQILMNRPKNARTDPTWDYIRTIGSSEPLPEIRLPNENLPMVNIRNLTLLPNLPGVGTQTANLAFKLDAIDTIFHPAKYIIAYYPTALAVAVPFPDFWHQFDVSIPSLVSTKLTAAIGLTDDSCYLQSDRYFPNADTIAIGDELVTYTGFDRPNLHITGISRHQLGTTAKTHPANEQVIDLQKAITTLTADVSNTEMSVIHVTSAAGFDNTNGVIRIDSEEIGYATRTGTTQFNGLTRPNPTIHLSGISHTNGTTVFEALPPVSGDINTLDLNTDYSVSITWQNGVNQIAQWTPVQELTGVGDTTIPLEIDGVTVVDANVGHILVDWPDAPVLDFNNYVIDVRRPLTDPAPYVNSIPLPTSFYDCAFNPNYRPYGSLRRFREKVVDRQGNIGPFNRYYTVYDIYGVAHTYDAWINATLSLQLLNTNTTSATVADTTGFPSSGIIIVESEEISYTSLTSTTFVGLTRGVNNTAIITHNVSAYVSTNGYGLNDGWLPRDLVHPTDEALVTNWARIRSAADTNAPPTDVTGVNVDAAHSGSAWRNNYWVAIEAIAWTANPIPDSVLAYDVWYKRDTDPSNTYSWQHAIRVAALEVQLPDLDMDTYYDFRIRAVNFNYATGNYQDSPDNTFFNFTTAAQPYIAPPRLLTVVGTTSFYNGGQYTSFADLKWEPTTTPGVQFYQIQYSIFHAGVADIWVNLPQTQGDNWDGTYLHDTVQLPHVNTTYRLRIFALNPIPGQANSNPAGYMLLTANISSTDTSDLFVSDVTALTYSGEVTVNIEDIDYTSQNVGLNKVSGLARHQNLTAAAAHTTGAPVQQQIYAITPAITAPNPPTSFTANSTDTYYSGNQYYADVAFTWTDSTSNDVMGYFIKYRTLNPNSQYYYSPTFNVSGAITLSGLLPATAYEFNLVAMSYANLQSTVDLCSPSSYTTQAITAPAAPAALTVTSTSLEFSGTTYFAKAALSWTAVSGTDIVGYYVTVLPAGGGNFTLPLATGTTITIHGLIPGGSYTFDVVAKNEANLYSTPTYNTGGTIIMPIPTVPTISSLSITYDEDMNITFSQSGTLAMITHYDVAMTVGITTHDITIAASVNSTINKVFTYRLLASIWGGVHAFNSISITGRTNGYGDTNTITATTVDCVNPAAPTSVIINDSGGDGGGGYAPGGITMTATSHQGQYPNTHFLVYSSPTSSPFVPTLQFEMLNSLPNIAWYGIPNLYYRTNAYSINSYAMTSSSYTTSNIVQCGGVHSIDVISLDGTKLTNQITRTVLDASDLSGSVNISGTAITNLDQSTVFTKVNTWGSKLTNLDDSTVFTKVNGWGSKLTNLDSSTIFSKVNGWGSKLTNLDDATVFGKANGWSSKLTNLDDNTIVTKINAWTSPITNIGPLSAGIIKNSAFQDWSGGASLPAHWASGTNYNISSGQDTTVVYTGIYSARLSPTGANATTITSEKVPVTAAVVYQFSGWVYTASASSVSPQVAWYTKTGTLISTSTLTSLSTSATTWELYPNANVTAPATATQCSVILPSPVSVVTNWGLITFGPQPTSSALSDGLSTTGMTVLNSSAGILHGAFTTDEVNLAVNLGSTNITKLDASSAFTAVNGWSSKLTNLDDSTVFSKVNGWTSKLTNLDDSTVFSKVNGWTSKLTNLDGTAAANAINLAAVNITKIDASSAFTAVNGWTSKLTNLDDSTIFTKVNGWTSKLTNLDGTAAANAINLAAVNITKIDASSAFTAVNGWSSKLTNLDPATAANIINAGSIDITHLSQSTIITKVNASAGVTHSAFTTNEVNLAVNLGSTNITKIDASSAFTAVNGWSSKLTNLDDSTVFTKVNGWTSKLTNLDGTAAANAINLAAVNITKIDGTSAAIALNATNALTTGAVVLTFASPRLATTSNAGNDAANAINNQTTISAVNITALDPSSAFTVVNGWSSKLTNLDGTAAANAINLAAVNITKLDASSAFTAVNGWSSKLTNLDDSTIFTKVNGWSSKLTNLDDSTIVTKANAWGVALTNLDALTSFTLVNGWTSKLTNLDDSTVFTKVNGWTSKLTNLDPATAANIINAGSININKLDGAAAINAINLQVGASKVTNIGGRPGSELANADFENYNGTDPLMPDNWNLSIASGSGTYTYGPDTTIANVYSGTKSFKITATNSWTALILDLVSDFIPVAEASVYNLVVPALGSAVFGNVLGLKVNWYKADGTLISTSSQAAQTLNTIWSKITYQLTSPINAQQAKVIIEFSGALVNTNQINVDFVDFRLAIDNNHINQADDYTMRSLVMASNVAGGNVLTLQQLHIGGGSLALYLTGNSLFEGDVTIQANSGTLAVNSNNITQSGNSGNTFGASTFSDIVAMSSNNISQFGNSGNTFGPTTFSGTLAMGGQVITQTGNGNTFGGSTFGGVVAHGSNNISQSGNSGNTFGASTFSGTVAHGSQNISQSGNSGNTFGGSRFSGNVTLSGGSTVDGIVPSTHNHDGTTAKGYYARGAIIVSDAWQPNTTGGHYTNSTTTPTLITQGSPTIDKRHQWDFNNNSAGAVLAVFSWIGWVEVASGGYGNVWWSTNTSGTPSTTAIDNSSNKFQQTVFTQITVTASYVIPANTHQYFYMMGVADGSHLITVGTQDSATAAHIKYDVYNLTSKGGQSPSFSGNK